MIDTADVLEPDLIELLHDEDHLVRMEAAAALAAASSESSRQALDTRFTTGTRRPPGCCGRSLAVRNQAARGKPRGIPSE